jgi:hypothetical protein
MVQSRIIGFLRRSILQSSMNLSMTHYDFWTSEHNVLTSCEVEVDKEVSGAGISNIQSYFITVAHKYFGHCDEEA